MVRKHGNSTVAVIRRVGRTVSSVDYRSVSWYARLDQSCSKEYFLMNDYQVQRIIKHNSGGSFQCHDKNGVALFRYSVIRSGTLRQISVVTISPFTTHLLSFTSSATACEFWCSLLGLFDLTVGTLVFLAVSDVSLPYQLACCVLLSTFLTVAHHTSRKYHVFPQRLFRCFTSHDSGQGGQTRKHDGDFDRSRGRGGSWPLCWNGTTNENDEKEEVRQENEG